LPPGMILGRGLTSVRGNRGKNSEKWTLGSPKNIKTKKKKKDFLALYDDEQRVTSNLQSAVSASNILQGRRIL
jgi:hypothetical protein